MRGFLGYFNLQLWQILDVFRPADALELLTDASVPALPYHRAAIFLESLGLAPAESALLTSAGNAAQWFSLYGYANQATALSALTSAATLADTLDITYQNLADIMETGFLNPALVPLTAPLEKFGLSLREVFTYTAQAGFNTPPQAAADKAAFEAGLQAQMAQAYPRANPTSLQAWLTSFLAAGYSNQVLVLQAPAENTCDFENTIFQYAGGKPRRRPGFSCGSTSLSGSGRSSAGRSQDEVDRALQVFLTPLPARGGKPEPRRRPGPGHDDRADLPGALPDPLGPAASGARSGGSACFRCGRPSFRTAVREPCSTRSFSSRTPCSTTIPSSTARSVSTSAISTPPWGTSPSAGRRPRRRTTR